MATKNIVPRITNEGKLGKPDKRWAQGNFSTGSFGLISGSLIPDAQESHNLGEAARPWKEIFVSTSSIKFVCTSFPRSIPFLNRVRLSCVFREVFEA